MISINWFSWFGLATLCWLFLSLFLVLYFCGDPNAPGPLGLATGLVYLCAEIISRAFTRVFGHRVSNWFFLQYHYIFRQSNPLLQGLYLLLVNGGYALFYLHGQRLYLQHSPHLPLIALTMALNFASFVACSRSDPGIVTRDNAAQCNRMFRHDGQLYRAHVLCPTCAVEKPARSKHCSFCDRCIMKFDHHCVWINNCVGLGNYRLFLWFLSQHVWFTGYGTYLISSILLRAIEDNKLWQLAYKDPASGRFVKADKWFVMQWIMYYHGVLWGLLLLLSVMFVVLLGFTSYHFLLAASNATTNERAKRGWIDSGLNVHSHHEILRLQPTYEAKKEELRKLNARIVKQAYEEAGLPVPPLPSPSAKKGSAAAQGEDSVAKAAADAAARVGAQKAGSKADAAENGKQKKTDSSSSSFPPGPYSASLTELMRSYSALKAELLQLYQQLQELQRQGFASEESRRALQGAEGGADAATTPDASEEAKREAQRRGLTLAPHEATEGCVPPSSTPPASSSTPTGPAGQAARVRRPNPYDLGWVANLRQVLLPPRIGEVVASPGDQSAAGTDASQQGQQSKKKR